MAGQASFLLDGGQGAMPSLTGSPLGSSGNSGQLSLSQVGPHHSVIVLVLLAVFVLFLLDKAGFKFAVTTGRG